MSLAAAMSTALTGLNASDTQIDVIGNNLANANTVGFKASDVLFATQFLQTQSVGSAPTAASGGVNPTQQGLGVEVAQITPNFTQGTIAAANSPTDLAIQGQGFFIVQGDGGGQNYTRNGTFTTNAENQLVTGTGNRVMGYGINDQFQIDTSHLQPLSIPLGTASVAKATTEATLQGTLTPSGAIANTASIIESNQLTEGGRSFPQAGPTAALAVDASNNPLPGNLSGTYQYYVTFTNGNQQSRPQLVATSSPLLANNQVTLSNFPTDATGEWSGETIYRSTNDQPGDTNLYEIATIPTANPAANYTYTDNATDASIRAGGQIMSFTGPPVTSTTLLSNVVEYDKSTGTFQNVFPTTGTLSFTGIKGGNTQTPQKFTITNASTLKDLATFLQGALGIQPPPGNDPNHPIQVDSPSGLAPGVNITSNGQIEIVGNDGAPNAIGIGLSSMTLTTGGVTPTTMGVNLPFNGIQSAAGQGTTTSMVAYDSLGIPLSVNITAVLESVTSTATTYRWYADCGQNDPGNGQQGIAVGTGTVTFNGAGNFVAASNTTISIGRANEPSVKPLQFNLDFSQVSGLAATSASLSVASQDGSAPGVLNSFAISNSGLISGVFSNGISQDLGQIQLARFTNPTGLEQAGKNMYSTGVNSGLPIIGNPGDQGTGTIVAGSLESSNTDVGSSLINLITSSTMYQANTRVITTATQLFDNLLQLGR
jgi:flagellar hook protein FlgE